MPGFIHIDIKYLPQMSDEASSRYLFAAINRAMRWVFMRIYRDQSEVSSTDFLRRAAKSAPFKITKLFTNNGNQFANQFASKGKGKEFSSTYAFDA